MLVIVICLPVVSYFLKRDNIPFNVNIMWSIMFGFCILMQPIIAKLIYVSAAGIAGSVGGSYLFKTADKIDINEKKVIERNELAKEVLRMQNEDKG